ncbi:RNA-directed DNA polymerase from mobile element jockey [Brachionus plicatilis]|uniref:RNA-directed DNA polymerase from mobile element jockey n=1 Tax=Brachionus plicatilis TaxID=10195 RepID=A0A3M7RN07_BRAPC|nr:RNA-directed DNA polymerase from mobile element jockey [Brachionus plicatilis]
MIDKGLKVLDNIVVIYSQLVCKIELDNEHLYDVDYSFLTKVLPATPLIIKGWHTEEGRAKLGLLEFTITRTRPHRLRRGYSCVLAVAVYIPEFNVSRLRSSITQLCHALEEPVTKCSSNNKPLIFVAGDFNGADVRPLCTKFYLRQINREPTRAAKCLDIILSNAPDCYISETRNPLGPPTSSPKYFNLPDEASTNSKKQRTELQRSPNRPGHCPKTPLFGNQTFRTKNFSPIRSTSRHSCCNTTA